MPINKKTLTKQQKRAIQRDSCLACCPITTILIGPLSLSLLLGCGATTYYCFVMGFLCPDGYINEKYSDIKSTQFAMLTSSTAIIYLLSSCVIGTSATLTLPNKTRLFLTPVSHVVEALNKTLEKHPLPFFRRKASDTKKVPLLSDTSSINETEMHDPTNPTTTPQKILRL